MSDIVLSAAVRQNLLSLQSTTQLLATTQNDLATGNKVNSALDNPTNYFTAQSLNNRASDINNLLDSVGNGVQVLQAANTGITSLQKLIDSAKSVANQALQATSGYSTKSTATVAVTGATADNLLGDPDTAATVTGTAITGTPASTAALSTIVANGDSFSVNGKTISFVTGAAGDAASTTDASGNISLSLSSTAGGKLSDLLTAIGTATGGTATNTSGVLTIANASTNKTGSIALADTTSGTLAKLGLTAGTTAATSSKDGQVLNIASVGGGQALSLKIGTGAGEVNSLDDLNTQLAKDNLEATLDSKGNLSISTTNDYAATDLTKVTSLFSGSATTASTGVFAGIATATKAPVANTDAQATRASLVSQYNQIIDQIKTTAQDSSFNGVNLLNGDQLKLVFNETGSSTLNIQGVTDDPTGLGLANLSAGTDFLDNSGTNKILDKLNNASNTLRSQASTLGSNLSIVQIRQDFSQNMINVLQTGASNLTLADPNTEAANSQALSTRQSIAVSALALANSSQQSVLRLLQ